MTEPQSSPFSTREPPLPLSEGEVLADKYKIGAVLGRGGMGCVLSATHLLLQQRVAIKLLLQPGSKEIVARFLREGQAAAKLKGEHVARVIDMGQLPTGAPYMVMEYLEGRDLGAELELHGHLPIEEAIEHVIHACEAMAEAHAAGIVHRDLKPANLFLTTAADGSKSVKVVDFGISRDMDGPANHRLTSTTTVIGSPLYMSPEQMRSARETDARSDIWSLGVILYELITGQPPFDAELYTELVLKVATASPPSPVKLRRGLPAKLEAAILRCLEKAPEKRFADVGELAAALAPFGPARVRGSLERIQRFLDAAPASRASIMPGRASLAPSRATASQGGGGAGTPRADAAWALTGQGAPPRRSRRTLLALAAVGITVVAAAGVIVATARRAPTATEGIAPVVDPSAPAPSPSALAAPRPQVEPGQPAPPATAESAAPAPLGAATALPGAPSGNAAPGANAAAAARPLRPASGSAGAAAGPPAGARASAAPPPEAGPAAPPSRPASDKNPLDLGIK